MRYPFAMECGVYRTDYATDMALHQTPLARGRLYFLVGLLYLVPLVFSSYITGVANLVGIFVIGALGLNIVTGYTGQISIGHGAFVGVGAYTSAFLTVKLGLSFWIALPAAGLVAALVGAIFGVPSLRLKGLYLAIATLAAQVILDFVFIKWKAVTGGNEGMNVTRPHFFGMELEGDFRYYYLILTVALVLAVFAQNLFRTRIGRAFIAIRDRDLAAEVMGVNLFTYKIMAFALSAFYAGVAGALWGHYTRIVSPEFYGIGLSIEFLAMVIIGGLGTIMGSIYGAAFMTLLPIILRLTAKGMAFWFPGMENIVLGLKEVVFGITIILFLMFEPEGLAKLWRNVKDYFRLWPFSY